MTDVSRMLRGLRELVAARAASGPYRYLVRRWDDVSDVDLAVAVLGTEFFKEELQPVPLPISSLRSIVVIAPHQDDETIGAGGLLLLAATAGVQITVIYITDGNSKTRAFAGREAEYIRLRDAEARAVCDQLGARMLSLGISNTAPAPTPADLAQISSWLHEIAPQVVLVPWILDSPPKHRMTNHLLWLAHQTAPLPSCEWWGYQTANTLLPNGYVDITSVADQKRRLLETFRSQNEHYARYDHMAMGMAAWNQRFVPGTTARFIETFFTLPSSAALALIGEYYSRDVATTYRRHHAVLAPMQALHEQVTRSRAGWSSRARELVRRVRRRANGISDR